MDYFDRVYCIHMPDPERRQAIDEQCAKVGIDVWRYVYAQRRKGPFEMSNMRRAPSAEFAVNLSHIMAVSLAIADGAERPLFIEDDIVFRDDACEILEKAVSALPHWDVLYLGGHPCEPVERINENLVKVGRFSFAEAYAINGRASLIDFQNFWFDNIGQPQAMYDFILSRFAMDFGYCVYPVITHQPPGYSHIAKRDDDKRHLIERGWQNNLS